MNIAFDLDGVLSSFEENAASVINSIWPGRIPNGYKPINWDWTDVLAKRDWDKIWEAIREIPDFWVRQGDYPDAINAVRKYVNDHYRDNFFYITSRCATGGVSAEEQTRIWLQNRGLFRLNTRLIVVDKPPEEEKRAWIQCHNIRFMLDDKDTTVDLLTTVDNHFAYCLTQPWNRHRTDLPRVHTVREYLETIELYRAAQKVTI